MRRLILSLAAASLLLGGGCNHFNLANNCNTCQTCNKSNANAQRVAKLPPNYQPDQPPGPAVGTYAYPYYTTRAPRDFLLNNPPTIGP